MNSITFLVDMYGNVLRCQYYEDIDNKKRISINLPSNRLIGVFLNYKESNPDVVPISNNGIKIFTFYDVDVDEIDKLENESKKYTDMINRKKDNTVKIKRTNKFKNTIIMASASIVATMIIFSCSKDKIINFDYEKNEKSNSYSSDIIFDCKPQSESFVIKDNNLEQEVEAVDNSKSVESVEEVNKEDTLVDEPIVVEPDETPNKSTESDISNFDNCLRLNADNLVNEEKYYMANAYYSKTLGEIAKRYGVDPALALAVCVHERGIHSDEVDSGGAVGLFQIQVEGSWNWDNKTITAYNFDINEYEDLVVTKENVRDVFINMQAGCMLLQNLLVAYDYNVAEAVTAYNYGIGNLTTVLKRCSSETGLSIKELNNINNMEWLKYRNIIGGGDPKYLENVFKYVPDETILSFTKPSHEEVTIAFDNLNYQNDKHM